MWPPASSSHFFQIVVIWMQSTALHCTVCVCMHGCVAIYVLCVISNKAVMDYSVQPFWVRWTESKYCTPCSDILSFHSIPSIPLSLFLSLPVSLSITALDFFFHSNTPPAEKKKSSKTVIYLHLVPSFHYLFPLSNIRAGHKHILNHTHIQWQGVLGL